MVVLGGGGGPFPLGKATALAVATDRLYVGTGDSASIDVYAFDGRRLSGITLNVPSRRPTRRNQEQAVEDIVRNVGSAARIVRQRLLELPMPRTLPPYGSLFVDSEDVLWVVLSAPGDAVTTVRALNKDGHLLGEVSLPVPLTVTDIGQDYILGVYQDPIGEVHVAMYRLRRGR
jgi:hypothetical protein